MEKHGGEEGQGHEDVKQQCRRDPARRYQGVGIVSPGDGVEGEGSGTGDDKHRQLVVETDGEDEVLAVH